MGTQGGFGAAATGNLLCGSGCLFAEATNQGGARRPRTAVSRRITLPRQTILRRNKGDVIDERAHHEGARCIAIGMRGAVATEAMRSRLWAMRVV